MTADPIDPQRTEASDTGTDPAEERLDIALPADLLTTPPAEAPDTPESPAADPPAPDRTATPPLFEAAPGKPPAGYVPRGALDAERHKRKEAVSLFEAAETDRLRWQQEATRLRLQQATPASPPPVDFNAFEDLNSAMGKAQEIMETRLAAERQRAADEILLTRVMLSQELLRTRTAYSEDQARAAGFPNEYDRVLHESGVEDAVTIDPQTGRSRDPFLAQWIYSQPIPALAAYEYGKGKLAERDASQAEARGEARGRKTVVEAVLKNAARPQGIARLPSTPRPAAGGVSRKDIDAMSDAAKDRLRREHPDVWRWWLQDQ